MQDFWGVSSSLSFFLWLFFVLLLMGARLKVEGKLFKFVCGEERGASLLLRKTHSVWGLSKAVMVAYCCSWERASKEDLPPCLNSLTLASLGLSSFQRILMQIVGLGSLGLWKTCSFRVMKKGNLCHMWILLMQGLLWTDALLLLIGSKASRDGDSLLLSRKLDTFSPGANKFQVRDLLESYPNSDASSPLCNSSHFPSFVPESHVCFEQWQSLSPQKHVRKEEEWEGQSSAWKGRGGHPCHLIMWGFQFMVGVL